MGYGEEMKAAVSHASGMVSVQAECSVDQALALMNDRAAVHGQTLEEIATAVVAREIRFGDRHAGIVSRLDLDSN